MNKNSLDLSDVICETSGQGLWSNVQKLVKLDSADITAWPNFGELRVYFDPASWNVEKDGLIYTDPKFLTDLRLAFVSKGFTAAEVVELRGFNYSEQGMQGAEYVSLDIGKEFLNAWKRLGMVPTVSYKE